MVMVMVMVMVICLPTSPSPAAARQPGTKTLVTELKTKASYNLI